MVAIEPDRRNLVEGTPFGRYRLLELLGRGGMGEVWRAFDTDKERVVAVKVLSAHLANDPVFEQRFRREAFAAASLNEPHVVPIHNFGEIDGRLYVDMRLIEGRDLETLLSDGSLAPGRSVWIVEQVASALHAAHRVGLVHRDVKPSNILILKDDFAYLIDFGIAQAVGEESLTSTGNTVGTWAYMAPERLSGKQIDARADVYGLACVLYECLTGSQPFPGDRFEQQIGAHLSMPPPRPSMMRNGVPSSLDPVIAKGMAKEPDDRYPTTKDLARAARSALTAPLPPVPPAYPVPLPTEPVATQETVRLPLPPTAHIAEPQTVRMPLPPTQPVRYVERGPVPPVHPPTTRDELSMAATAYRPMSGPQPALQPPTQAATPPPVSPEPPRKKSRALMIAVISAVIVLAVVTTVVVLSLGGKSGGSNNASGTSGKRPGPINGTFSADLGAETTARGLKKRGRFNRCAGRLAAWRQQNGKVVKPPKPHRWSWTKSTDGGSA
jgi:serine/threonine-protein kinase